MKNLTFYGDVAKSLESINKKFNLKKSLKNNFIKKVKEHKIALIITALSLIIPVSGFLNIVLWLVSIGVGFKCLKNIGFDILKEASKEKKELKKEIAGAKTVLYRFTSNTLKLNGISLSTNNFKGNMKNIGTYSDKKLIKDIVFKREEETINTYIKMKDTSGKIYVLKQMKKQLLTDGKQTKEFSSDYQLLTLKEADKALTKEKQKTR